MKKNNQLLIGSILLCLTLGLAPFYPEPHIWGKLKWIAGGAEDMALKDWWDVLLHGFPYILFIVAFLPKLLKKRS
jgi:hypothetical protein